MNCPRCQRLLIGRTKWCLVHGETEDFGPRVAETHRDIQRAAATNQVRERPWEDDEAENLVLPGFEFPREMVVSTFDALELSQWTAAMPK